MTIYTSDGQSYDDLAAWHLDQPVKSGEASYSKETDTFQANEPQKPEPIRFIYGRHGETDANEGDKVRGQGNIPINSDGRQDAEKLAESIRGSKLPAKYIVASPVDRAKETADIVGSKLGLPVETHPGLAAWDVGHAEGQKDTGQLDKYCEGPLQDTPPPGSSESINQFKQRVMGAIGDITDKYPEGAVVIAHNSTERAIAETLNGENYKDDGIQPGQHKEFTIENQIHSFGARFHGASDFGRGARDTFNQRFEGEPGKLSTKGPYFDSRKMPEWWVRQVNPQTRWPGEGPQWLGTDKFDPDEGSTQKMPYFDDSPARYMPISMKETPGSKQSPLEAGGGRGVLGGASGKPTIAIDYNDFYKMSDKAIAKKYNLDKRYIESIKEEMRNRMSKEAPEPSKPTVVPDEPLQKVPNPTGRNRL